MRNLTLGLVATLCFSVASYAEEMPDVTGTFFALSVQDIDAAIEWYSTHLEFSVEFQGGNEHRKGALLTRAGTVLELTEPGVAAPFACDALPAGRYWLTIGGEQVTAFSITGRIAAR